MRPVQPYMVDRLEKLEHHLIGQSVSRYRFDIGAWIPDHRADLVQGADNGHLSARRAETDAELLQRGGMAVDHGPHGAVMLGSGRSE